MHDVIRTISNQRMFMKEPNHISAIYFLSCFGSADEGIVQNTGLLFAKRFFMLFIADRILSDCYEKQIPLIG